MQYDSVPGSWVLRSGPPNITVSAPANPTSNSAEKHVDPRPKPPDDVSCMAFWNRIFGDAMARFKKTFPQRITDKDYDIRCKGNWGEVSAQLDAARCLYLEKSGMKGRLLRTRRSAADNIQPVIQAMQLVPDIDYTAPVLGVVKVLLGVSFPFSHVQ